MNGGNKERVACDANATRDAVTKRGQRREEGGEVAAGRKQREAGEYGKRDAGQGKRGGGA